MLKVKNIPFIGGDTMEFSFDFGTKVAGSTAECPLNWYYGTSASAMTPSTAKATGNVVDKWNTDTAQVSFDQLKVVDGSYTPYGTITANNYAQFMVELDLTPLCSSLFGGSTSAMQTALKRFDIGCYAKGSGTNGNGAKVELWVASRSQYPSQLGWGVDGKWSNVNTSNIIMNISLNDTTYTDNMPIDSNNKIHLLIYSLSSSNGTISSEIDVDYINIKLQFARVPDVINLLPITLPQTWSMLIKGFSPTWNTTDLPNGAIKFLLGIDQSEHSNYDVSYQGGKFVFDNWDGSTAENLWSEPMNLTKFQTVNLLIEQTDTLRRMRILKNQGSVLKYAMTSSRNFPGDKQMSMLMHVAGSYQADAFFNSLFFMPNRTFDDDVEAETVLRGTAQGFEEDELVTDGTFQNGLTNYPRHGSGISVTPGKAVFTALGSYINQTVPVLPNNKYILDIEGNCANGFAELINGFDNGTHYYMMKGEFVTGPHTTQIALSMYPTAAGQYVTSVSLKLKM